MGGTSRVATCHDKDVLGVEVKRDIPQDMGLHLVARRASIDKDRPKDMLDANKKMSHPEDIMRKRLTQPATAL
jgi:hypothetical protein